MFTKTLSLDCGPCGRLAWDPTGKWLAASQPHQRSSFLLDLQRQSWSRQPFRHLGPWSPEGETVLAWSQQRDRAWILEWPSLRVLRELPYLPWSWLTSTCVIAPAQNQLWEASVDMAPRCAFEDSDGLWRKAVSVGNHRAAVLRWRPSFESLDLMEWHHANRHLAAQRLPDLATVSSLRHWSWSPDKAGWAAVIGRQESKVCAWAFPQGWSLLEQDAQKPVTSLAHWGQGMAWVTPNSLEAMAFEDQSIHYMPHHPSPHVGGLAWCPVRQTFAAASATGVDFFYWQT